MYYSSIPGITSGAGSQLLYSITQTAHGFAVGDVLRFDGTNYLKAQADSADHAEVIGIVAEVSDANIFSLQIAGKITSLSGLANGTTYFLSPVSAGAITTTEPDQPGQVSKPILVADSSSSAYVLPYRGVEVSSGPQPMMMQPFLHVQEQQPTGTNAGESVRGIDHIRNINTVLTNEIAGASLSANQITLPAGTYIIDAFVPCYNSSTGESSQHRGLLYNVTDSSITILGMSAISNADSGVSMTTLSHIDGKFSITSQKTFEIRHYINGNEQGGLGISVADGRTEVYSNVKLWKLN